MGLTMIGGWLLLLVLVIFPFLVDIPWAFAYVLGPVNFLLGAGMAMWTVSVLTRRK